MAKVEVVHTGVKVRVDLEVEEAKELSKLLYTFGPLPLIKLPDALKSILSKLE